MGDELAAWLRLVETPGVGRGSARQLLAAFGSAEAVVGASTSARAAVVETRVAAALADEPAGFADLLARTAAWLEAAGSSRHALVIGDPLYPQALLETPDPPLLLYAEGDVGWLGKNSVAIVGSRNPTPQGLENARAFSRALGRAGLTIVSGLALGIDGAAHEGALDAAAGTIAVVGTGLDRVYPARHRALAHRIVEHGLMVSEFALGTPALPLHFPVRNRIIAGLARGTLVVEAAMQSGSLITARMALECGRDVFAIPGSIHAPQSRGCHLLIKQGAKLVDAATDVLEEFGMATRPPAAAKPAAGEASQADALLDALGFEPLDLDTLIARTGCSAAELSARLLDLELAGQVARRPGQIFQRIVRT